MPASAAAASPASATLRTYLTTPPGAEPETEPGRRDVDEPYSPGLALPREPRVRSRHRRLVLAIAGVAVVAIGALLWLTLAARSQGEDPSLSPPAESPAVPADDDGGPPGD